MDLKPRDGYIQAPVKPGLGIEIDESKLISTYRNIQYRPLFNPDGSVAEI